METISLDKSVFISRNSHLLGGDYSIRKNKMVARFSVVSGPSKRRGKCENLEKIALRKRQKMLRNMVYKKI